MKFKAPANTTDVKLSNGAFTVDKDGCIDVPEDTLPSDIGGLTVNGFTPFVPEAAATPAKATKSADPAPTDAN